MKRTRTILILIGSTLLLFSGCINGGDNGSNNDFHNSDYIITREGATVKDETYSLQAVKDEVDVVLEQAINNETLLLDEAFVDLDGDGYADEIKLLKVEQDICIKINQSSYYIEDVYSDGLTFFDKAPFLTIIGEDIATKGILVSYSYQINGVFDGLYKGTVLTYENENIKERWSSNLENQDVSYKINDNVFSLMFNEYSMETEYSFDTSKMEDKKFTEMLSDDVALEAVFNTTNSIKLYNAEYIEMFNNNGIILVKNPIFIVEENAYIATLYSFWTSFDDGMKLLDLFITYKYSNEEIIIKELLSSGSICEEQLDEIIYNYGLSEKYDESDLLDVLNYMIQKEIIIKKEKTYYLRIN